MGFVHALEVLNALAQVAQRQNSQTLSREALDALPYPHLQQRLQQTLRGVVLVAALGIVVPVAALCFLPMLGSSYAFPGTISFVLLSLVLLLASLAQILVRYVMLPAPRPFLPDRASIYGFVQTLLCVVFDAVARVYQEPQLLVLLTLCVFHSWLWKACLYAITTAESDSGVGVHFSAFAFVGGVVSFVSFLAFEKSIGEDPFVLDPRAALQSGLQRDFVRAVRRGVIVWSVTHALLVLTQADESLFSLRFTRAYFQITSSVVENFVWLTTAAMFRILLFRANHKALDGSASDGTLWDFIGKRSKFNESFSVEDLFCAEDLAVSSQNSAPLNEQYVVALRKRVDSALNKISSRKVDDASSFAFENVEALDTLFKYENLLLVTKFNREARKVVFASEPRWRTCFQSTTACLDAFTLSLQLLNAVPERKNQAQDEKLVVSLDKSFVNVLAFVLSRASANPLLLLDAFPHLANLRLSPAGFKSKIQYYLESRAQFAVRRFLIEEARRRVFLRSKVVFKAQELLCHLVSTSRAEDAQGIVQVRCWY